MNKIGLFVDYANLLSSCRRIWKNFDFKKLIFYLEEKFNWKFEFKFIYFAYPEKSIRSYDVSWIHKFAYFLKKDLNFCIKKKPLKQIKIKNDKWNLILSKYWNSTIIEKWNLDIELTMDIMQTWKKLDSIILFSWDSDFMCLTKFLLLKRKKVHVFSTKWNISNELKIHSSKYYDIKKLSKDLFIWKFKQKNKKS